MFGQNNPLHAVFQLHGIRVDNQLGDLGALGGSI
jgi:hypothetical protein